MIEKIINEENDIRNRRKIISNKLREKLKNEKIVIYGCGNCGTTLFSRLSLAGYNVVGFIDKNSIYGNEYSDVPVVKPDEWEAIWGGNIVIIVALYDSQSYYEIEKLISNSSREKAYSLYRIADLRDIDEIMNNEKAPSFSVYLGENIDALSNNKDRIVSVYNALSDKMSKQCYLELFKFYFSSDISYDFSILPFDQHYFAYDLYTKIDDEVFIDCGAYDGDTYSIFCSNNDGVYKEYIAIEADSVNCKKIIEKSGRIVVLNKYLSSDVHDIYFENTGTSYGQALKESNNSIKTDTLDNLVHESKPTFIKINVEGAEMDVLRGAKKIVEDYKPILAIQGHHRMCDLWEIVEFFVVNQYEHIYLRNYNGIDEFTFYAIPANRLV